MDHTEYAATFMKWERLKTSEGNALSLGRLRASPATLHHRTCLPTTTNVVRRSPQHRWHAV